MNEIGTKKWLARWLWAASIGGLMVGLGTTDESVGIYSFLDVVIIFVSTLAAMLLFGLVERIISALVRALQKVGGKPGSSLIMERMTFFRYAGLFFSFVGLGTLTSTLWREPKPLWLGLGLLGGGLGLLLGLWFREKLFVRNTSA